MIKIGERYIFKKIMGAGTFLKDGDEVSVNRAYDGATDWYWVQKNRAAVPGTAHESELFPLIKEEEFST